MVEPLGVAWGSASDVATLLIAAAYRDRAITLDEVYALLWLDRPYAVSAEQFTYFLSVLEVL